MISRHLQPGGEFQRRRRLVQLCLEASTKGIDRDQSNGTIRQQRRLLEELMNFASNLVSVLEIGGILLRSKWAACKAQGGRISEPIRDRRATQPPAHFHHNPLGRVVSWDLRLSMESILSANIQGALLRFWIDPDRRSTPSRGAMFQLIDRSLCSISKSRPARQCNVVFVTDELDRPYGRLVTPA